MKAASEQNLDECCEDHGHLFGQWGSESCPKSLLDVTRELAGGGREAEGGKSGTKPLLTHSYVIKVIDFQEYTKLMELLVDLHQHPLTETNSTYPGKTFLTPTCRIIALTHDKYIQ